MKKSVSLISVILCGTAAVVWIDRNGRIVLEQQCCHWFSNDVASADYHTVFACNLNAIFLKDCHNAAWSSWRKTFVSDAQKTYADRMETVHILFRKDCTQHNLFINLFWKRKLNQNSVHCWIDR